MTTQTRPGGNTPQAERLREIYQLLRSVEGEVGTLRPLIPYVVRTDEDLVECLAALETMAKENDGLTSELAEKLRLIRELLYTIETKTREGDELSRDLNEVRKDKASLQRILATLRERVTWHQERINQTRGEGDCMADNNRGQRHLPVWALLVTLMVGLVLSYLFDAYVGPLTWIENHLHVGVAWILTAALLGFAGWLAIKCRLGGNKDIPLGNGEEPNGTITTAQTALDEAQEEVDTIEDEDGDGLLSEARFAFERAQGALTAAMAQYTANEDRLHQQCTAAAVAPGTAEAQFIADIQAVKAHDATAHAGFGLLVTAKHGLETAEAEVERLEDELEEMVFARDERKAELEAARNALRPPASVHPQQIRAAVALVLAMVVLTDMMNMNYMFACVRAQGGTKSTFWTSAHTNSPQVNVRNTKDVQLGVGSPITVRERQSNGKIPVFTSAKLGTGVTFADLEFIQIADPDEKIEKK